MKKNFLIFFVLFSLVFSFGTATLASAANVDQTDVERVEISTDSSIIIYDFQKAFVDTNMVLGIQILEFPTNESGEMNGMMLHNITIYPNQGSEKNFNYNQYMGSPFFTYSEEKRQQIIEKWLVFYNLYEKQKREERKKARKNKNK